VQIFGEDLSLSNDTYHYAIMASNEYQNSSLSNVESVEVAIPAPVDDTELPQKIGLIIGLSIGGAVVIGAGAFFGIMFREQIIAFLKKLRR